MRHTACFLNLLWDHVFWYVIFNNKPQKEIVSDDGRP